MKSVVVLGCLLYANLMGTTLCLADEASMLRDRARQVPQDAKAALHLEKSLRRGGLYEDAIRVARKALAGARGQEVVGDLFLEGRPTTAQAFADRANEEFPSWVAAGDTAAAAGEKDRARAAYRRTLAAKGPIDKGAVRGKLSALK
jgi:tetratricopeptide (TPR) repeat protein